MVPFLFYQRRMKTMSFLSKFFDRFKSDNSADRLAAAAGAVGTVMTHADMINNILKAIDDAKAGKAPANGYTRKNWEIVINNALNVAVAFIPEDDKQFQKDVLDFVTKYKSKTLVDFAIAAQRAVNERDK